MRSGLHGVTDTPAIQLPRWETDTTILFVGVEGTRTRRPYRYDVAAGQLSPLAGNDVVMHGVPIFGTLGRTAIYADIRNAPSDEPWNIYPYARSTPSVLNAAAQVDPETRADFYLVRGLEPPRLLFRARANQGMIGPFISPDERWAVTAHWPWGQVYPAEWVRQNIHSPQYILTNLETGASRPLVDAPVGDVNNRFRTATASDGETNYAAYWSNDARHVLLVNTRLPGQPGGWIVDVDIATGEARPIEPLPQLSDARGLKIVSIDRDGDSLFASLADRQNAIRAGRRYVYDGGQWTVREEPPRPVQPDPGFEIAMRESANEPQWMAAVSGRRVVRLTPDDPALAGVARSSVETIRWTDSHGEEVEALLTLPPGAAPGARHPLVIQLSDLTNPPTSFRPDGQVGTAFAVQALAAQGFAVLQVEPAGTRNRRNELFLQPGEGAAQVERVDDAVTRMRARGVADDRPIGLIGFSRSGYYAYYVATHPGRTPIGAVVPFDGITYGFGEYVLGSGTRGPRFTSHYGWQYVPGEGRRQHGQGTFWSAREAWLDAPTFNLHRLTAPTLMGITGPAVYGIETLGAFQLARRPYEQLLYADGAHILAASSARASLMQATVDWMNFWLLGRDPAPNPGDLDRRERWQQIRDQWRRQQAWEAAGNPVGSIPSPGFAAPTESGRS